MPGNLLELNIVSSILTGGVFKIFVGGSKVDPKLHPIHKGTCGDTIHSINTMVLAKKFPKLINVQDGISLCRMYFFQKRIRFCCTIIQETRVPFQYQVFCSKITH